jgi:hypothetical protein
MEMIDRLKELREHLRDAGDPVQRLVDELASDVQALGAAAETTMRAAEAASETINTMFRAGAEAATALCVARMVERLDAGTLTVDTLKDVTSSVLREITERMEKEDRRARSEFETIVEAHGDIGGVEAVNALLDAISADLDEILPEGSDLKTTDRTDVN